MENFNLKKLDKVSLWSLGAAALVSIVSLYFVGDLRRVIAYQDLYYLPTLKLVGIHAFIFLTMTLAGYYLIRELFQFKSWKSLSIVFIGLLSGFLAIFSLSIHAYVNIGDYLRDVHGINWYFMDWAGWAITMTLYLTFIYSFLIYKLLKRFLSKKSQLGHKKGSH